VENYLSVHQDTLPADEFAGMKRGGENEKGGHRRFVNSKFSVDGRFALHAHAAKFRCGIWDRAFKALHTTCSLAADEAALILARFYMSPPASPGGPAF